MHEEILDIDLMGKTHKYWLPPHLPVPPSLNIDGKLWTVKTTHVAQSLSVDLYDLQSIRTILVRRSIEPLVAYIHYLYWQSEKNLIELDDLIINKGITKHYTQEAIICSYNYIKCLDGCRSEWHALEASHLNYWVTNLPEENIKRLRNFRQPVCPNCGATFRIPVVKILG